jgi:hypothetical protein
MVEKSGLGRCILQKFLRSFERAGYLIVQGFCQVGYCGLRCVYLAGSGCHFSGVGVPQAEGIVAGMAI